MRVRNAGRGTDERYKRGVVISLCSIQAVEHPDDDPLVTENIQHLTSKALHRSIIA